MSDYLERFEESGTLFLRVLEGVFEDSGSIREEEFQEIHGWINSHTGDTIVLDVTAATLITLNTIAQLAVIRRHAGSAGKDLETRCLNAPQHLEQFRTTRTMEYLNVKPVSSSRLEQSA